MSGSGDAKYNSSAVDDLLVKLEEATRATPEGGPARFIPPAGGELNQVKARFHHFIFGRRGSGKTSLLRFLESGLKTEGRPTVWIDQELFMELTYPDVLVSSVLEVVRARAAMEKELERKARPWWRKIFGVDPKPDSNSKVAALERAANNLASLLTLPDDREVEWVRTNSSASSLDAIGEIHIPTVGIGGKVGASESESSEATSTETVVTSKEQYLERSLRDFRELIAAPAGVSGFIFLDEFYRVKRPDQPRVLGYMHRLVKDTGLWLKIASVRYWTTPYKGGTPPQGMQPAQDANEVSLDRGLKLLVSTQEFVEAIFVGIAETTSVDVHDLWTEGALKRLVIASGGVPRDYLRLARQAVLHAKNRGPTAKQGSERVMAEDVNAAAGQTANAKLDDLRSDAPDEARDLEVLLEDLGEFCRHNAVGYFLLDSQDQDLTNKIDQLQDLRLVHLLEEGETLPDASSRRHRVFLLDVAYLSFKRARQVDFEGWQDRSSRRRSKLVYTRGAGERLAQSARETSKQASRHEFGSGSDEPPPTIPLFGDTQ